MPDPPVMPAAVQPPVDQPGELQEAAPDPTRHETVHLHRMEMVLQEEDLRSVFSYKNPILLTSRF